MQLGLAVKATEEAACELSPRGEVEYGRITAGLWEEKGIPRNTFSENKVKKVKAECLRQNHGRA